MIKIRNDDVKIKCHKCGNEYDMGMMRMDPATRANLICRSCLDRKPVSSMGSQVAQKPSISQKQEAKPAVKKIEEQTEYFCKECKYNFKRASHLHISRCPYCGSDGTVSEKGSTARIIADASRMKD